MKTIKPSRRLRSFLLVLVWFVFVHFPAMAGGLQLVSALDGSTPASNTANGDSYQPFITPDGRYVLFESTANNLVTTNNAGPVPGATLHKLNAYLRDRVNGVTTLASVNTNGDGADWDCVVTGLSSNGQYVLFESKATDLVSNDNHFVDGVFVRDVVNGITTLVSVNTNGASGNGSSRNSVMTPDGRYVAFVSDATDLVSHDTNGISDVFVRDLQAGTTALVSVGAISTPATQATKLPNGSDSPVITPDGRYVAFFSTATNLAPNALLPGEVYVRDLIAGTTTWASTNARSLFQANYGTTNAVSGDQLISADGKFVTFETFQTANVQTTNGLLLRYNTQNGVTEMVYNSIVAPPGQVVADYGNIDMSPDGNFIAFVAYNPLNPGHTMVFLQNMQAGTALQITVTLDDNTQFPAIASSPRVDATGRYVAFFTTAANVTTNLASSPNNYFYVRDTQLNLTRMIGVDTNGAGVPANGSPAFDMNPDASLIVFDSSASNLVPNDRNRDSDIFLRDLTANTTGLVSVRQPGLPSQVPDGFCQVFSTSLSTNGRYVAFTSEADNLVANDTNGCGDVFMRDLWLQTNLLVSVGNNGFAGIAPVPGRPPFSFEPSISGDGRYVAFSSYDTNLLANRINNVAYASEVYLRDMWAGTNSLVSAGVDGSFGNASSYTPTVSLDGRFVLYHSLAKNLTTNSSFFTQESLFLRDVSQGTNYALTVNSMFTASVVSAAMTPDGHRVAYIGVAPGMSSSGLLVWDSLAAQMVYSNSFIDSPIALPAYVQISADGRRLAYFNGSALYAYDLIGKSNVLITLGPFESSIGAQFSLDDRFLLFMTQSNLVAADTNGTFDVYLHDFQTGTNLLISQSFDTANAANGAAYSAAISPDGRFVAYVSSAKDTIPGDTNGAANLFLYDRMNQSTMLLSVNQSGTAPANSFSQKPIFTGDSSNLVFVSYASNLPGAGFNERSAIFSLNLSDMAVIGSGGDGSTNAQFNVQFLNSPTPGQNPTISWQVTPGTLPGGSYQVQFKNNLTDPVWSNLNANATIVGSQGRITDFAPPNQRFYRVVLTY